LERRDTVNPRDSWPRRHSSTLQTGDLPARRIVQTRAPSQHRQTRSQRVASSSKVRCPFEVPRLEPPPFAEPLTQLPLSLILPQVDRPWQASSSAMSNSTGWMTRTGKSLQELQPVARPMVRPVQRDGVRGKQPSGIRGVGWGSTGEQWVR